MAANGEILLTVDKTQFRALSVIHRAVVAPLPEPGGEWLATQRAAIAFGGISLLIHRWWSSLDTKVGDAP